MNIDTTITIDTALNTGLALLVWHLVMAEGGEISWELDDGSRMVLKAEKQEPPQ